MTFYRYPVYNLSMERDIPSQALLKIEERLRSIEPELLASKSGALLHTAQDGKKELLITLFGRSITVTYPGLEAKDSENREIEKYIRGLILYYLVTGDGAALEDRWVALSELPDGGFYNSAYQGYSGNRLVLMFGNDLDLFEKAALSIGGGVVDFGDIGYRFKALPRVPLLAVYWKGDEEVSSQFGLLFNREIAQIFSTEDIVVLAQSVVGALVHPRA